MKRKYEVVSSYRLNEELGLERHAGNRMGQYFMLVTETGVITDNASLHQPYRLSEARVARVISGQAVYQVNLVEHTFRQGDFLVFPPETIVELESLSADYALEVLTVIN
ncbi:MAG: hypothetical protein IJ196_00885 [Prevotella sp.]|nr:hypothetical protein [Prevotella sp.]